MITQQTESPPISTAAPTQTTPANPSSSREWIQEILLLVILLGVATAIHFQRGPTPWAVHPQIMGLSSDPDGYDPPSMDEVWNLALSTGRGSPFEGYPRDTLLRDLPAWTSLEGAPPVWKVWTSMSSVTHPPLYIVTLRLWRSVFGGTDLAAVSLSCTWSCVALIFVYLASRLALGRAAAFWSVAALAVSPVATYYAIEIRSYAMLTAESAIAIWLLVRLTKSGPRTGDIVGLCAVLLACVLTHYFSGAACVAAGLYALAISGRRWRFVLSSGLITAVVYAMIWGPFLKQQLSVMLGPMDFLATDGAQVGLKTAMALCLPIRLFAEIGDWPPVGVSECIGAVAIALAALAAIKRPALRPFFIWFAAVALSLWLADVIRHTKQLAMIRYCAATQPAGAIFVSATAVVLLRHRAVVHVAGAIVCALALYIQPTPIRNDAPTYTSAPLSIAPRMAKDDVLLIYFEPATGEKEYFTDGLVLNFAHVPGFFPRDAAILYHPATAQLLKELSGRNAWLLNLAPAKTLSEIIPGAVATSQVNFWPYLYAPAQKIAYSIRIPPAAPDSPSR